MAELTYPEGDITVDHAEIISGIEAVYQTLIDMGYVQNTDVQVPPHGLPKEPIAVAPLRAVGMAPKTIELIGRLPCFTNEIVEQQRECAISLDGIPYAPYSAAASYLLGSGRHDEAREVGIDGKTTDESLPSTAFKLATTHSPQGYNLAYDLADKSILQWHPAGWAKCRRLPAAEFMSNWNVKLKVLDWLPWTSEHGWEVEERTENSEQELADPNSAIALEIKTKLEDERKDNQSKGARVEPIEEMSVRYLVTMRAYQNRYWARRRIYEECGWPDSFDPCSFKTKRDEFNNKAKELGSPPSATAKEFGDGLHDKPEVREFYKNEAGPHAV